MRVYLDAAPVIYLVERNPEFMPAVRTYLARPHVLQVCSDLTRLECRVKPISAGNEILLNDFDTYFTETVAEIVPLTTEVVNDTISATVSVK